MSERKELMDESLGIVNGGFIYSPEKKLITPTAGGKVYHYTDYKEIMKIFIEVDGENMTSSQVDAILFPKLLEAGLIYE